MQLSLNDAVSVTMTIDHHNSNKHGAMRAPTCHSVNTEGHHTAITYSMFYCGCTSF